MKSQLKLQGNIIPHKTPKKKSLVHTENRSNKAYIRQILASWQYLFAMASMVPNLIEEYSSMAMGTSQCSSICKTCTFWLCTRWEVPIPYHLEQLEPVPKAEMVWKGDLHHPLTTWCSTTLLYAKSLADTKAKWHWVNKNKLLSHSAQLHWSALHHLSCTIAPLDCTIAPLECTHCTTRLHHLYHFVVPVYPVYRTFVPSVSYLFFAIKTMFFAIKIWYGTWGTMTFCYQNWVRLGGTVGALLPKSGTLGWYTWYT